MYIRVGSRVYEVYSTDVEVGGDYVVYNPDYDKYDLDNSPEYLYYTKNWVDKETETLEEMCDRFVFCDIYWGKEAHRCEDRFNALLDRYNIIIDETLPCFVENQYYKEDDSFIEIEKGMWLDKDKVEKGVYGAIWTGKGLIYVVKMNEKGELVLI